MPPAFNDVAQAKSLLLTTFSKDDTPKPTARVLHSLVRDGIDKVHVALEITPH